MSTDNTRNTGIKALLTSIYTLTPMHCGASATSGAVDLPIARESHTLLPILPASSLKGACRAALEPQDKGKQIERLFGPELNDTPSGDKEKDASKSQPSAGALAFTEGRLLGYPVRALVRPWLLVTAPFLIERVNRDLRAMGLKARELPLPTQRPERGSALVSHPELHADVLVLEDLICSATHTGEMKKLAEAFAVLLPDSEGDTQRRIRDGLVLITDEELLSLIQQTLPVQARIKLNDNKTTTGDGGNLWYEEHIPSESLFVSFILTRPGSSANQQDLDALKSLWKDTSFFQIGGNETVGMGLCWWQLQDSTAGGGTSGGTSGATKGGATTSGAPGRPGASGTVARGSSTASSSTASSAGARLRKHKPGETLSAQRQQFVLEVLSKLGGPDLTTRLKGAPIQVRQLGLVTTLATLGQEKTLEDRIIGNDILAVWLLSRCPVLKTDAVDRPTLKALLTQCIQDQKLSTYRAMQQEALQILEVSKRLAQVYP